MWLMPCSRTSSSARSASRLETSPRAAAPKITRLDSCPVAPKGARSIIGWRLRRGLEGLRSDHRQELELARVLAAGRGGEDDEPLGLVLGSEDLAVERDHADRRVHDPLAHVAA